MPKSNVMWVFVPQAHLGPGHYNVKSCFEALTSNPKMVVVAKRKRKTKN